MSTNTAQENITSTNNSEASNPSTNTFMSSLTETSQNFKKLFPKTLDDSGYVILVIVALIFAFFFMLQARLFTKVLSSLKEGQQTLKSMSISLYTQQQLTEYRLLLGDLSHSSTPVEKANARTQLYNHLNTIAMEICENKDRDFARQLAKIFFSKIKSRYLKLVSIPDGLLYFKYLSQFLLSNPTLTLEDSLRALRKNVKKEMKQRKELEREDIVQNDDIKKEKKSLFDFIKKDRKK